MLLEFRVSNFLSFDSEQTFSLVASQDTSLEDSNINRAGELRVLKSAALFGANASGKSNLVVALGQAQKLIAESATKMNLGDEIQVDHFLLRERNVDQPSEFSFALLVDGVRYDYGFAVTRERVHSEWIVAYPHGKPARWLERYYDARRDDYDWKCRGPLERELRTLRDRTRSNGLALSRGAEQSIEVLAPLYLWFKEKLRVLDLSGESDFLMPISLELFTREPEFHEFLDELLRDADMGIHDVRVVEKSASELELPADMPSDVRKAILTRLKKETLRTWLAKHKNLETGEFVEFPLNLEAQGTQRVLALAGPLWEAGRRGYTLVVDELDCSLHPSLVRSIIEMFHGSRVNSSGAQLVFTTHDATLMDLSLLRRDQVWIAEKESSGATRLASLYDFAETRPRLDEAVGRRYLAGRYGGVPTLGPMFEGLR